MFLIKRVFFTCLLLLTGLSILSINLNAKDLTPEEIVKVTNLKIELIDINKDLEKNIWITRYNNYLTYRQIEKELSKIKIDAKKYF